VDLKDRLRLEAFVKLLACEEIDDDGDDDEVIVHEGECSIKKLGHKWQRPQKILSITRIGRQLQLDSNRFCFQNVISVGFNPPIWLEELVKIQKPNA
jgi:hypothetical protein